MSFYQNKADDFLDKSKKNYKIEIRNVDKSYLDVPILKNININLKNGELVSIVGPSGCGKSTIFNMITGLEKIDCGKIFVDGKVSYMYQKNLLLPYKNIIDNVSLPLIIEGSSKKNAREKVKDYFQVFGLTGYEKSYPRELSGGMKQRANFLRTFIYSNDIMLLDEPFGALDSITKRSLIQWFLDVRKRVNSTIFLITHDIEEAIMLSDRIYVLSSKPTVVRKEILLDEKDFEKSNLSEFAKLKEDIIKMLV